MDRAYGVIEFRAVDDSERILEGVASTDALDDFGTVLEPQGARFSLPIPLLWQHERGTPVGDVLFADVTKKRITVRAQIRNIPEPGPLKDACDRAWQAVKHKLVRGFSVGFMPMDGGTKGNRFTEWKWRELSLVTLPANEEATISKVRSIADSGASGSPGLTGIQPTQPRRTMTIQEQITQHENSRAAKVARKQALMEVSNTRGSTLDTAEAEEFDTLDTEIRSIDGHLVRLNSLKRDNEAAAVAVPATPAAPGQRAVVRVRANVEPGIGFARYALALAASRGNQYEAAQIARQRWGDQSGEVVQLLERAAVAAGSTTDATWAAPLVQPLNMVSEFLELLRPATILGKLQGLRHVPFNIAMPAQTAGGTYQWTGQAVAKPVSALALSTVTLGFAKATGIIVISKELAKFSNPSAERIVRDDMVAGIAAFLDVQFTDPAIAAVANVNPASITNGIAGTAASGTTEAAAEADLTALLGGFVTGNFGMGQIALLMNEGVAFTMSRMRNAVGTKTYEGLTATGGTIGGVQVVTSNAITAATGIIAVHTPSVLFADDGGVEIDASEQASVQMDSAPANPADATTVYVSLWQRNLIGLRAERFINWKLARATAVRRIHTVAYV